MHWFWRGAAVITLVNAERIALISLVLVGGFGCLLIALRRSWSRKRAKESVCGNCGYPAKGLPTLTCPECGSDLRDVGIITPKMPRPFGRLAKAFIWSTLLPLPAWLVTDMARAIIPRVVSQQRHIILENPQSGAYKRLTVIVRTRGFTSPYAVTGFELKLTPHKGYIISLEVDTDKRGYSYQDPDAGIIGAASGLREQTLLDWMQTAKVDTTTEVVQSEAGRLYTFIHSMSRIGVSRVGVPGFGSMRINVYTQRHLPRWYGSASLGCWLLVWMAGVFWFLRRRS